MTFESWAAFAAAAILLLIIPGPTVLLVVSYALGQGWRTALPMAIGVALGDFTAMTLSMLGLGALLAASATLFTILKWVGAAYLVYLGVKLWRAGGTLDAALRTDAVSATRMLGHAWLVTALNPKSITFFGDRRRQQGRRRAVDHRRRGHGLAGRLAQLGKAHGLQELAAQPAMGRIVVHAVVPIEIEVECGDLHRHAVRA